MKHYEKEARRLSMLRIGINEYHPFWGYLLMQVSLIPSAGLGESIAATDCLKTIFYNPDKTQSLSLKELGFVLLHELGHMVYATIPRKNARDHFLWNCATDYAINRIVSQVPATIGGTLYSPPEGILLDKKYDGMIAETIYETLVENPPDFLKPRKVTITLGDQDGSPLEIPGVLDHDGGLDIHLPCDLTDEQREDLDSRIRAAIQHWEQANKRGHIPGNLEREFGIRKSRIDWKQILRSQVCQAIGVEEYSLSRPNKKWLSKGFIVPGISDEKVPLVAIALDTSASMDPEMILQAVSEIRSMAEGVADLILLVCDAKIHEEVGFANLEQWLKKGKASGGGGTSHIPVFNYLHEKGICPEIFVGFSDLFSTFPARRPFFPVLWVTPCKHGTAPWGRVLAVE